MNWGIITIFLSICSFKDIRKKEISFWFCVVFILIGISYVIVTEKNSNLHFLTGIIPGIIFFMLGILAKKHIGIGDGVMIVTLGFYFDLEIVLTILFWSFCVMTLVSLIIVTIKKEIAGVTIPMAPFLLIGEICTLIIWR